MWGVPLARRRPGPSGVRAAQALDGDRNGQHILRTPCGVAGPGLLVRELLKRVKETVMGAVANAEVPVERALEVAGIPAEANVDAISVAVHDEGFFKVGDMEGFEARPLVTAT